MSNQHFPDLRLPAFAGRTEMVDHLTREAQGYLLLRLVAVRGSSPPG
jgi:hypothetical protein